MSVLNIFMWLVIGAILLFALLFLVALVAEIVQLAVRKRARGRAGEGSAADPPPDPAPDPPSDPPSWRLSLLVSVDEEERLFRPSVQLRGSPVQRAAIRLELVDRRGITRAVSSRSLPPSAIESELSLPPFEAPVGVSVEEVLRWHWDVAISDPEGEKARWREHPGPAGGLNAEAEIEMPRLRQARPTDISEDVERAQMEDVLRRIFSEPVPPV